ncbi:hypothetical protein, partial [Clostridioides difficile]|uniref:hypothetical protein n=1 Tax=Clostridioides difficile TaxID=1496 RepID=UPI003A91EE96
MEESFLLIGTQSIEVSLDISYDVPHTELAPLDSLLHRFGRVNRRGDNAELSNTYICLLYSSHINIYLGYTAYFRDLYFFYSRSFFSSSHARMPPPISFSVYCICHTTSSFLFTHFRRHCP